jgi:hypothetical protein
LENVGGYLLRKSRLKFQAATTAANLRISLLPGGLWFDRKKASAVLMGLSSTNVNIFAGGTVGEGCNRSDAPLYNIDTLDRRLFCLGRPMKVRKGLSRMRAGQIFRDSIAAVYSVIRARD